jgi:aconitate hydratase
MLGQCTGMVLPEVIGFKMTGELPPTATATDLVLLCTQMLRNKGVVDKFVEFYGPGVKTLTLADRATISNMAPEYGATIGLFPMDQTTLNYLKQTGRSNEKVEVIASYLKTIGLFKEYDKDPDLTYSSVLELDLSTVEPCVSGPKRPQDYVSLKNIKNDWNNSLTNPVGFKGYGLEQDKVNETTKL